MLKKQQNIPTDKFETICRICLKEGVLKSLYEPYDGINLFELLKCCSTVKIEKNDNLPKHICIICITELIQVYNFTKKFEINNSTLNSIFVQPVPLKIIENTSQNNEKEYIIPDKNINLKLEDSETPKIPNITDDKNNINNISSPKLKNEIDKQELLKTFSPEVTEKINLYIKRQANMSQAKHDAPISVKDNNKELIINVNKNTTPSKALKNKLETSTSTKQKQEIKTPITGENKKQLNEKQMPLETKEDNNKKIIINANKNTTPSKALKNKLETSTSTLTKQKHDIKTPTSGENKKQMPLETKEDNNKELITNVNKNSTPFKALKNKLEKSTSILTKQKQEIKTPTRGENKKQLNEKQIPLKTKEEKTIENNVKNSTDSDEKQIEFHEQFLKFLSSPPNDLETITVLENEKVEPSKKSNKKKLRPRFITVKPKMLESVIAYNKNRQIKKDKNKINKIQEGICPICKLKFKYLNKHFRAHSREELLKLKVNLPKKEDDNKKKLVCDICQKRFLYQSNLVAHKLSHETDKKYVCSYCNRSFNQLKSLKRHENIHTQANLYECEICNRKYNIKSNLWRHQRKCCPQKITTSNDREM